MTVVLTVLYGILTVLLLLMVLRFTVGFFDTGRDAPLLDLVWMLTEPVVYPIRALFDAFGADGILPFDVPLVLTGILVGLLCGLCRGGVAF